MKVQKIPSSLEDGEAAHTLVHGLRTLTIFFYILIKISNRPLDNNKITNMKVQKSLSSAILKFFNIKVIW
jgi:hypothetical protein